MKIKYLISCTLMTLPLSLFAVQSYYCPQKTGYIKIGMTTDQVLAACGQPQSLQESNITVTQRVPVQQLIFNNHGTSTALPGPYTMNIPYNIPGGTGGVQLQINIVNNKVQSISMNGASTNVISSCQAASIQAGDPVSKVYNACGSPDLVNNSYINQTIPSSEKPQVWTYQLNQYQPSVTLTFVGGTLQSIQ